jgi:hypothetical protein
MLLFVVPGLVPGIPIEEAEPCHRNRDGRDKPGHDVVRVSCGLLKPRARLGKHTIW